ncbi:SIR2 family protein [Arthrobacter sp. Hz1]
MSLQPRRLDPRISLAVSIHDQPGVFALLIGSGTSTGAGIPTGWGVIKDLAAKAAAAAGKNCPDLRNDEEVENWWEENGNGSPLGYSNLLESMGKTAATRSALLNKYFEASENERAEGLKVPGDAHRAIAKLVQRGAVRVIVTTNFDRLIEQALESVSVQFQVITNESEAAGRKPLVHAPCTVVKLHGDYRSLNQRNTAAELDLYGPEISSLLQEILENFGIVINGWSADWDKALVAALRGRRTRRYPLYWTTLHPLGSNAQSVAEQHSAAIIDSVRADDFFSDLVGRLDSLDSMSSSPLTADMAVARLKRLLPRRESYIEIRDLLGDEVERITQVIKNHENFRGGGDRATQLKVVDNSYTELREATRLLIRLVTIGVMLDRDRIHTELWSWCVQRLLDARASDLGSSPWVKMSHYPALLLLRSIAMIGTSHDREDVFVEVATKPVWIHPNTDTPLPAFVLLQDSYVIDHEIARDLPRWNNQWIYPASQLVNDDLISLFEDASDELTNLEMSIRRAEYRMALAMHFLYEDRRLVPSGGLYAGERAWSFGGTNIWEEDFRKFGDRAAWRWTTAPDGHPDSFSDELTNLSQQVRSFGRR